MPTKTPPPRTQPGTTSGLYMTEELTRDLQAYRTRNGQNASIGQWVKARIAQARRAEQLADELAQLKAQRTFGQPMARSQYDQRRHEASAELRRLNSQISLKKQQVQEWEDYANQRRKELQAWLDTDGPIKAMLVLYEDLANSLTGKELARAQARVRTEILPYLESCQEAMLKVGTPQDPGVYQYGESD